MTQSRLSPRLKANHGGLLGATNQQRDVASVTDPARAPVAPPQVPLVTSKRVGLFSPRRGAVAARLGDVLYWLGCILAVLFLLLPLLALIDFVNGHPQTVLHPDYLIEAAIASWLTGRTLRYVFAGT
jgi:hypothetical protein